MREALQFLVDLVQKNGALPPDRAAFRLAEVGKVGLWWGTSRWLGDAAATGNTLRVAAAPIPRRARGGAVVRARHWCLGANGPNRDAATQFLGLLAGDDLSHRYCAGLSLPPVRRANWNRPTYTQPTPPGAARVWPAVLAQLDHPENVALVGFPGYRTTAARFGGELVLVLTGKKPIAAALTEGEAGVADLLKWADEAK
jgi:hypothetical protein